MSCTHPQRVPRTSRPGEQSSPKSRPMFEDGWNQGCAGALGDRFFFSYFFFFLTTSRRGQLMETVLRSTISVSPSDFPTGLFSVIPPNYFSNFYLFL